MRSALALGVVLVLFVAAGFAGYGEAAISNGVSQCGCRQRGHYTTRTRVLAGSPTQLKSSSVSTRLYVRALVLSAGGKRVAIVTLDTLKYPVEQVGGRGSRSRRPPAFQPATSSSAPPTLTAARCGPITRTNW